VIGVEFATGQVDPADRLPAWRELVNRVFLPLTITSLDAGCVFDGSVTGSGLGDLRVWAVKASPMRAVRTSRHISASGHDDYLLALHLGGIAHAEQDGREVRLGPGDLALFDASRPYSISFRDEFEHVIFQVPRSRLGGYRDIGAATATRVAAGSSAGRLVAPYLRTLADLAVSAGQQPPETFVDAGVDLAVSALRRQPAHADPRLRALRDYAMSHLGDPALSPGDVALAGYTSVRQVHRLFAAGGVTFGDWVREQRLRLCHDDLADPRLRDLSIAEIAARHGFRSAAHFSRAFRARYGCSPGTIRRANT
jgi:AraC-like DNA-binding protein